VTILVDPGGIAGVRLISYPDTYFHYLRPCPRLAIEPCWVLPLTFGISPLDHLARYQTFPGGCSLTLSLSSLTCTSQAA
jgi:hypothetical protein